MNTFQQVILFVIIAATSAAVVPWTGPLADHKLGELVPETSEVAAARRNHEQAYAKIRSILPELSPEELENSNIPVQLSQHNSIVTPASFPHPFASVTHAPIVHNFPHVFPTPEGTGVPWTGPIADHKLGEIVRETPEVAAARKHHQDVFSRVRSALPEIRDEDSTIPVHYPQVSQVQHAEDAHVKALMERIAYLQSLVSLSTTVAPVYNNNNQFLVDTPEVAAAKLEHARAIAAVLGH